MVMQEDSVFNDRSGPDPYVFYKMHHVWRAEMAWKLSILASRKREDEEKEVRPNSSHRPSFVL